MARINLFTKKKPPPPEDGIFMRRPKVPQKSRDPADTPRDFLEFFDKEFKDMLSEADIPGMSEDASWDRKAAWLLWTALGRSK